MIDLDDSAGPDPTDGDSFLHDDPTFGAFVESLRASGTTDELTDEAKMVEAMSAALGGSTTARARRASTARVVRGAAIAAAMVVAIGGAAAAATGTNPFRPVHGNVEDAPPSTTLVVGRTVAPTDAGHSRVDSPTSAPWAVTEGATGPAQSTTQATVTTSVAVSSSNGGVSVTSTPAADPTECKTSGEQVSGVAKERSEAGAGCAGSNRPPEAGPSPTSTGSGSGKGAPASNEPAARGSGATGQSKDKPDPREGANRILRGARAIQVLEAETSHAMSGAAKSDRRQDTQMVRVPDSTRRRRSLSNANSFRLA